MCTGPVGRVEGGLWAEFKLIHKADRVPRTARGQAVCSVIDPKVFVIRLFYVSHF